MPQCMGQSGRYLVKAPLHAGADLLRELLSDHKYCQSVLRWKASQGYRVGSGRQASRDPPAIYIGHIRVTSCESSSSFQPLRSTGSRETPSTDLQGVTASPAPFANQRITVTWQVSERHCQRVGSSFRRRETNCTFYILHYMWLCTICWYPDDGVHVWNIWYLAFSRRHEMKCIIHRVTSVFATVVTNPLCCFILSPTIWFLRFLAKIFKFL